MEGDEDWTRLGTRTDRIVRAVERRATTRVLADECDVAGKEAPEKAAIPEGTAAVSREETPKVGMPLAGLRTGGQARMGWQSRGQGRPVERQNCPRVPCVRQGRMRS